MFTALICKQTIDVRMGHYLHANGGILNNVTTYRIRYRYQVYEEPFWLI